MKEHEDIRGDSKKYTLDCAHPFTLTKHKLIGHMHE